MDFIPVGFLVSSWDKSNHSFVIHKLNGVGGMGGATAMGVEDRAQHTTLTVWGGLVLDPVEDGLGESWVSKYSNHSHGVIATKR